MDVTRKQMARLAYIDALRIGAVLWLVPFHTARIYDIWEPNYVKSGELSAGLSAIIGCSGPWHMPLFFVLAGASTFLALNIRTGRQYLAERTLRLLVPLLAGILLLVPIQPYYALLDHGTPPGSYLQFLAGYFVIDPHDLTGYSGSFTPSHLWFILYLFLFSILLLPLFLYVRSNAGRRFITRLAGLCSVPGLIFLFIIPLALTELLPAPGGKNPFFYALCFIFGFVIMCDEGFQRIIDSHKKVALITGVPALTAVVTVWLMKIPLNGITPSSVVFALVRHFAGFAMILALLGYGRAWLDRDFPWLRFAGRVAFTFYILHQIVIVVAGYYIIRLVPEVYAGFVLICLISFLVTAGLCRVIMISPVTRLLSGMK